MFLKTPEKKARQRIKVALSVATLTALTILSPTQVFAACTSPTGTAGKMIYNGDDDMVQYCDGTNWIAAGRKQIATLNESAMPTSGLVGHWKMDETSGATAADSSGNGNNGTLTLMDGNTDWVSGKINNALDFDGSNDYVALTDSAIFDVGGSGSWCLWLYPRSNQTGKALFIHDTPSPSATTYKWIGSYLSSSSGGLGGYIRIGGTAYAAYSTDSGAGYYNNKWTHTCLTFNKDLTTKRLKFYINGILSATNDATNGLIDSGSKPVIGTWLGSPGYFDGLIDDVRMYNRALTSDEIATLAGATLQTGLVGHWKLDETSGTTAADSSGNGNNGTMQGSLSASNDSVTGKINAGLDFDGINDYINIGNKAIIDSSTEVSICFWLKYNPSSVTQDGGIISKWAQSNATGWMIWVDDTASTSGRTDTITFMPANGTVRVEGSSGLVTSNKWGYYCATFSGGNYIRLYKNGVLDQQQTSSVPATIETNVNSIEFGRTGHTSPIYLDASLDDVRIYNRALSTTEIGKLLCSSDQGKMYYNADLHIMQFCSTENQHAMGKPPASPDTCTGTPAIGTVCGDGSVYAGISPDGNVPMWTTPADKGSYTWGSNGILRTGISLTNGDGNTTILASYGASAHPAAYQCDSLSAHGHDDWYLPARGEVDVLYTNRTAIGGFSTSVYNTSSQGNEFSQWIVNFSDGSYTPSPSKATSYATRCVRHGTYAAKCANPVGNEGEMLYNTDYNTMQYCNGVNWVAIGK